ncbi:hypothetical protein MSAN_00430500 [Mycena sanguinolenta]|uniref:F-box domain-containing protein n=1 Tax=Mycena sanguinolenta TaxID=230812 RepID=A0A8H6ZDK9_9AGAR|nr:hypothetical protein MSAN_00430500 [Mycena sanguinolenta]
MSLTRATYLSPTPTLANIPIETLWEIAAQPALGLVDLLHLTRTCKSLHRVLAGRQSRHVWRAKLSTFAACPASIPGYTFANLSNSTTCWKCDYPATADWDLQVRLCRECLSTIITTFDESQPPVCLVDFPSVKIRDLVNVRPPTFGCAFVTEELDAIRAKLDNMKVGDRAAFISQRKAMMVDVRVYAREYRDWEAPVHAEIRSARIPIIKERLTELGWDDEVNIFSWINNHELVTEPIELTDEVWNRIRPELEAYMIDRRKRARADTEKLLRSLDYCTPLTTKTILMSLSRIAELPVELLGGVQTGLADLIQLSRTCKSLYLVLVGRHSRHIWQAKLASLEYFPACPPSLSVYAYADLVSLSACQGCDNAPKEVDVDWDLRVRLCKDCLPVIITTFDEAQPPFYLADFPSVKIRDLVHVRPPTPHGCAFVTEELDAIRVELDSMDVGDRAAFLSQRKAMMVEARTHARECREVKLKHYRAFMKKVREEGFKFMNSM